MEDIMIKKLNKVWDYLVYTEADKEYLCTLDEVITQLMIERDKKGEQNANHN